MRPCHPHWKRSLFRSKFILLGRILTVKGRFGLELSVCYTQESEIETLDSSESSGPLRFYTVSISGRLVPKSYDTGIGEGKNCSMSRHK